MKTIKSLIGVLLELPCAHSIPNLQPFKAYLALWTPFQESHDQPMEPKHHLMATHGLRQAATKSDIWFLSNDSVLN